MSAPPLIALTTDFGWGSSYVAQLKGVILSLLPQAPIVDVSHSIPPQSIRAGELLLRSTAFAFPLGTVHIVVVDPGVGSTRRPLAAQSRGMTFVGPDNGVLGGPLAQPGARCVHLNRPELFRHPVSETFHGRDIFAPVACELAAGMQLTDVGVLINDPLPSTLPVPRVDGGQLQGEILGADSFGNLLTNIPARGFGQGPVWVAGRALRWVRTYEEAAEGETVALFGSDGYLEVAVRNGSAATTLQAASGLPIQCARNVDE